MPYDFDKSVDRRDTHSLKWDVKENELPMWVADMDFQTAPEILAAIQQRAAHGVFGYSIVPEEWYQAYIDWWERRHGFSMEKDWLIFCTGVVPAISSMVRKLTTAGENVLIQTPVYNIFFNSIVNNGRNVVESPLKYDGNTYQMSFEDLERKLSDPQTTLMILCNPHNPVGRIWSREELEKVGELCRKYHVTVISDEIHCDLTAPGQKYVPFASVSESCKNNSITCIAPTKAFNLAGLQTAAVAVPDSNLRHKVWRGLNTDGSGSTEFFYRRRGVAGCFERVYSGKQKICGEFFEKGSSTDQAGFFTGYLSDVAGLPEYAGMRNGIYAVSEGAYGIVSVGRTSVWGKRKFLYQNEYRMSQKQAGGWIESAGGRSQKL